MFGHRTQGDFLLAGKYLLFLEYNAIGNDYSIASSSFGNVLTLWRVPAQRCCRNPTETRHSRLQRHLRECDGLGECRRQPAIAPSVSTGRLRTSTDHRQRARCGAIEHTASSPHISFSARFVVGNFRRRARSGERTLPLTRSFRPQHNSAEPNSGRACGDSYGSRRETSEATSSVEPSTIRTTSKRQPTRGRQL